ncbi:MAG: hypothetical protein KDC65_13405 [Saprospiraceae bacterium]|nr:hypothetical protein [Saprospiraceae bacterium]
MKKFPLLFLFLLVYCAGVSAQTSVIIGKWSGSFPGEDGQTLNFSMTISDDSYQIDFGMDGRVDITGSYTADGDQVTVWDTAGENTCPSDQKGVYKYALDGDTLTFTQVKDDCPGRGSEPMVLKRM